MLEAVSAVSNLGCLDRYSHFNIQHKEVGSLSGKRGSYSVSYMRKYPASFCHQWYNG